MEKLASYPKVYALGHDNIKELFMDDVIVQEKVDGSQFSFGVFDGGLKCRSRGKQIIINAPDKMFFNAIESLQLIKNKLHEGWLYRGEYLQKPHHNTLSYDRIPKYNIIIFDINIGEEEYLNYKDVKKECERIGLECVPKFYEGKINNVEDVLNLLDTVSILGDTIPTDTYYSSYVMCLSF